MKDIEFRVWDEKNKAMVEPDFINKEGFGCWEDWRGNACFGKIIMQYVGIKDKNNRKIYEGDILRQDNSVVIFYEDGAMFALENFHASALPMYHYQEKEIIGNIYESPELLYWKR